MALFSPYIPNPCTNKFHECWNLGRLYSLPQPQYLEEALHVAGIQQLLMEWMKEWIEC